MQKKDSQKTEGQPDINSIIDVMIRYMKEKKATGPDEEPIILHFPGEHGKKTACHPDSASEKNRRKRSGIVVSF